MRNKILYILLFYITVNSLYSQEIQITSYLSEYKTNKIYLYAYNIEKYVYMPIDSTIIDIKGKGTFKGNYAKGLYKINTKDIQMQAQTSFDIWLGEEKNVVVKADCKNIPSCITFQESEINKTWYELIKKTITYEAKLPLLQWFHDNYPDSQSNAYEAVYKELVEQEKKFKDFKTTSIQKYKNVKSAKFYKSISGAENLYTEPPQKRMDILVKTFFKNLDFSDPYLQQSHLIVEKIQKFFKLRFNLKGVQNAKDADIVALQIVKDVTNIVKSFPYKNAKDKERAITYVNNYLLFEIERNPSLQQTYSYILKSMPPKQPSKEKISKVCTPDFKNLMQQKENEKTRKTISTNTKMTNFEISTKDEKIKKISDISKKYVLLVFWSSSCKQSIALLDQLQTYYKTAPKDLFEIVAVGLDTNKKAYNAILNAKKYPWINHCDFLGVNTESFKKYGATELPMMYLMEGGNLSLETIVNNVSYIPVFIKNHKE